MNLRAAAKAIIVMEQVFDDPPFDTRSPGIRRVKGVRRLGVRVGNWVTVEQARRLLQNSAGDSPRGKRNHAILALLIGCGLRRGELLALNLSSVQLREEH
jgi:site-specific recombinase XerC